MVRSCPTAERAVPTVEATALTRDLGRLHDEAHRGIIKVTNHSRLTGAQLSA